MKKQFIFLSLLACLLASTISAQQSGNSKFLHQQKVKYIVRVKMTDNQYNSGSLLSTGDSTLMIAQTGKWYQTNSTPTEVFSVNKIWQIQAKKRNQAGTGVIIGGIAGFFLGGLIGKMTYKPCHCQVEFGPGFSTAGGAIYGVASGALIGGLTALFAKKTILIEGNHGKYTAAREKLKRLSILKQ